METHNHETCLPFFVTVCHEVTPVVHVHYVINPHFLETLRICFWDLEKSSGNQSIEQTAVERRCLYDFLVTRKAGNFLAMMVHGPVIG